MIISRIPHNQFYDENKARILALDPSATFEVVQSYYNKDEQETQAKYLVGRTVRKWERNGYDDSDFYCGSLLPDGTRYVTEYASTRYANGSYVSVDASDEVRAEYERLEKQAEAEARAKEVENAVAEMVSNGANETTARLFIAKLGDRLRGTVYYCELKALLCVRKFRSEFRASLRKQVEAWLETESPVYADPLSPKQRAAIISSSRVYRPSNTL